MLPVSWQFPKLNFFSEHTLELKTDIRLAPKLL